MRFQIVPGHGLCIRKIRDQVVARRPFWPGDHIHPHRRMRAGKVTRERAAPVRVIGTGRWQDKRQRVRRAVCNQRPCRAKVIGMKRGARGDPAIGEMLDVVEPLRHRRA